LRAPFLITRDRGGAAILRCVVSGRLLMKRIIYFLIALTVTLLIFSGSAYGSERSSISNSRVKFYNFDEILIDGKIKKPTGLYTNSKRLAKFDRLIKLKKSFIPDLLDTSREHILK
jgi:hypothetical protein